MGDYQVLFSGEVSRDSDIERVQARLARELGIDDRKARALFSGRTVVIRSQLSEEEARTLQHRLADLGAICRIKSLASPRAMSSQIDKDTMCMEGHHDQTLKDITAAHVECPRCGHLQLEASHCARCGIDMAAALAQKRKEDLLIEKKIRELRAGQHPPARRGPDSGAGNVAAPILSESRGGPRKRTSFVRDLFRRS
jgi:ribosomal protein L37E